MGIYTEVNKQISKNKNRKISNYIKRWISKCMDKYFLVALIFLSSAKKKEVSKYLPAYFIMYPRHIRK
jgi:hypothetical protein